MRLLDGVGAEIDRRKKGRAGLAHARIGLEHARFRAGKVEILRLRGSDQLVEFDAAEVPPPIRGGPDRRVGGGRLLEGGRYILGRQGLGRGERSGAARKQTGANADQKKVLEAHAITPRAPPVMFIHWRARRRDRDAPPCARGHNRKSIPSRRHSKRQGSSEPR